MGLWGHDYSFSEMLEAQADAACRAAAAFHLLARDFADKENQAVAIKKIEHEADSITHRLANKIDSTFVTPLDKEDLGALSSRLDDVTDAIEAASGRILIYQLQEARPDLEPLAALLVAITAAVKDGVTSLRHIKGREAMTEVLKRVHSLENESDVAYRQALGLLLNTPGIDPILIIKWKEVYDRIEIAIDRCEDVANAVESVVVKYA